MMYSDFAITTDETIMAKIKIYSGLTLDENDVAKHFPEAVMTPPIQRGDIWNDIKDRVQVIAIIDGKFHQNLPVSINEIMDGLRCGIAIYGSSSMGALRAAELRTQGMIGHGKIFEFIRDNPYFRDDYLGQVFEEKRERLQKKSRPYIDFYFNVEAMVSSSQISRRTGDALNTLYRNLPYPNRNWENLEQEIKKDYQGNRGMPAVLRSAEKAAHRMGSQKRKDALDLLDFIQRDLKRVKNLNNRNFAPSTADNSPR